MLSHGHGGIAAWSAVARRQTRRSGAVEVRPRAQRARGAHCDYTELLGGGKGGAEVVAIEENDGGGANTAARLRSGGLSGCLRKPTSR